jgi:hypothetical protein
MARCRMRGVPLNPAIALSLAARASAVTAAPDQDAQASLNVAVVPATDSAGFFIAWYDVLPAYPVGPVDQARLQRVADVMRQFFGFPAFSVAPMLGGS